MNNKCKKAPLAIGIVAAATAVAGGAVMVLWNNVAHPVLKVNKVTYGQAVGTFVLSRLLFGARGRGMGRRGLKKLCNRQDSSCCKNAEAQAAG